MMWLWWVLGGLAVLVVVPLVIGMLLPRRYSSSVKLRLNRTPEEVWKALNDHRQHPMTGSMCKQQEELKARDGKPVWREEMGSSTITVETLEEKPPHRLVRKMKDSVVPMETRWEYTFQPADGGTLVEVREEGAIDNGTWHVPIFRLMVRLTAGAGIKAQLKSVAKSLGGEAQAA